MITLLDLPESCTAEEAVGLVGTLAGHLAIPGDAPSFRTLRLWRSKQLLSKGGRQFTRNAEADWGDVRIVRVRTDNAPKVLYDGYFEGIDAGTGDIVRYDAPKGAHVKLFKLIDTDARVYLSFGDLLQTGRILGSSCYRMVEGLKANDDKPRTYTRKTIDPFAGAWSTPNAVELTVVRTAAGERPDQLAQLVDWLRTLYEHIGDWTTKPAPLYFEEALKEYLADFDLDEEEDDGEEGAE